MLRSFANTAYSLRNPRQFIEHRRAAQPQLIVDRGIAANHGTRLHIVGNTALRRGNSPITDFAVSGNPDLTRENDVIPDLGRTGKTYLCAKQSVLADSRAVSDLH